MVYAPVGVSGCQKGDNFRVMDRVFIGPFDIDHCHQPIFVGIDGWKSQNDGDGPGNRHFIFSSPLILHFTQNAAFAWLG